MDFPRSLELEDSFEVVRWTRVGLEAASLLVLPIGSIVETLSSSSVLILVFCLLRCGLGGDSVKSIS